MFEVTTIGSATFDIFLKNFSCRTLKESSFATKRGLCLSLGSKISVGDISWSSGGGAINTAISFAKLGLKTSAIFSFGKDIFSQKIKEDLTKVKVDFSLAYLKENFEPPISVILSLPSGERTILHAKRRPNLSISFLKKLKTKWLYLAPLAGEGTSLNDRYLLEKIIQRTKEKKFFLASNPSLKDLEIYQKKKKLLNFFDVLILNQEEASYLTKIPFNKEKEIFRKLDNLVEGIIVMTKGKRGVVVSNGYYLFSASIFPNKKVIDRTGAGDSFAAAFIAGLIKIGAKNSQELKRKIIENPSLLKEPIRLASANATSVVESIGAHRGALTYEEFKKNKRWQNLKIKIKKISH